MAAYGDFMIGTGVNMATTAFNNMLAEDREHNARYENYRYGEMAALNADQRTRALYNDLQSPSAIMRQLKEAGLSPSLMYGGNMGGSVGQGAQGSGAAGISPTTYGMTPIDTAQLGLIEAETRKKNAETQNVISKTEIQHIEANMKGLENEDMKNAWNIMNSQWKLNGDDTSIFEIAQDCYSYEQFMKILRENADNDIIKETLTTEKGQEITRSIFMGANKFHRDIMVLSAESVDAKFQLDISEKLSNSEFAKLNAEAAVAELKKSIQTSNLDERQTKAWNNLLKRLEKSSPTTHDILIVLGMILNNALTNYKAPILRTTAGKSTQ